MTSQSHGHVTPNADGYLARCGGPSICAHCQFELAQLRAKSAPAEPVSREAVEVVGYMSCDGLDNGLIRRTSYKTYTVPVMTVAQHNRIVAALTTPPPIEPALTNSQCACGDEYAANSYGAGFMAANNGVCENCDTYTAPPSPDAELVELLREAREFAAAYVSNSFFGANARKTLSRIDAKLASLKP